MIFLRYHSYPSSAVYVSYLLFQLWSHTHLYKDRNGKSVKNTPPRPSPFLQIPSAFFNQEKKTQKPFVTSPSSSQEESGKLTPVTSPLRGPHRVYQSPNYTSSSELILLNPSTDSVNRPHSGLAVDPTVRLVDGARGPPPTGHSNFLQRTFSSTSADSSTSTSMLLERGSNSGRSVSGTRGRRYSTEDEKSPVSSEGSEVPSFTRKEPRLSWFLTLSLLVLVTVVRRVVVSSFSRPPLTSVFVQSADGRTNRRLARGVIRRRIHCHKERMGWTHPTACRWRDRRYDCTSAFTSGGQLNGF